METLGVLLTYPMMPYLEQELDKRFNLFRFWESTDKNQFLKDHSHSIRAIVGSTSIGADAEMIDALPNLEIVSSFSVGLDKIDLCKCRDRGIRVTNTPNVLTDDVADLAIGLILATLRKICASDLYVRRGLWKESGDFKLTAKVHKIPYIILMYGVDLIIHLERRFLQVQRFQCVLIKTWIVLISSNFHFTGKSVGIVGLGRIGSAIAKRAEAFSCHISYYSRIEKLNSKYRYYPSITILAANSEVLVVACPLTEETYHIINREVIETLGPKGVLVNIGRGPLVDEHELVSALLEGRLGGAGLDVFEHEPEPPEQLFGLDNVVLLPHVGSSTWETCKEMADLVIENLEAHVLNKPLLTPVL